MNENGSSNQLITYLSQTESKLHELIKSIPLNEQLSALRDTLFYAIFIVQRCGRKNGLKRGYKSRSARNLRALQPRHTYAIQTELLIPRDHFNLPGSGKHAYRKSLSLRDWDKLILSWYRRERPHVSSHEEQRSLLHFVACHGSVEFIKRLLLAGVSVREDQLGLSPIMWACYANRLDILRVLDEHVKAINQSSWMCATDQNGWTPICYAIYSKKGPECFEFILQNYGVPSIDKLGRTILHHASVLGKLTYCKQILEKADSGLINKMDNQNRTALHLATACGHGDIVHLLLTYKANPKIGDECGHSALTYARVQHLNFCSRLLTRYARSKENLSSDSRHANDKQRLQSTLGKMSQSASHLNRLIGCSSFDSSSDSLDPERYLWSQSSRCQSWGALRQKQHSPDCYNNGGKKAHLEENAVHCTPRKLTVCMSSSGDPLYRARENLTIEDEEEVIPVPSTEPPRPRKLPNGVQCGHVKSTEQRTNSVILSHQQTSSTRQRSRRASMTTNDMTQAPFIRPPSRVGALAPHERPSTPCPAPILVAKPICTTVSKSPRPPSAKYRPVHAGDPGVTQKSQKFTSDTSDVDQLAEVHHVIRIPTRTYRTSARGFSTVQTIRTVGEQRGVDNLLRKPEPVKSCSLTRVCTSSCSSISEQDIQPLHGKPSRLTPSADATNRPDRLSCQIAPVCDGRLPDRTGDTVQPGRLLKRNQISWNLGSIKKFFHRRDKTPSLGPVGSGLISTINNQVTPDYAEITADSTKPSQSKYVTTMKLKDRLPKNTIGPPIRHTLLTPSADHLTRSSIRSVRR